MNGLKTLTAFGHIGLASALAASPGAHAQSSVQIYGLVDLSLVHGKPAGGAKVTGLDNGSMTTSYLGLKGTEDLGNGLSAIFNLESYLRADTGETGRFPGDAFWARTAYVGVKGGFGSLRLGRNTTPLFVSTLLFNAFGDSFGFSPSIRHYFATDTVTGDTGWNDSILYTTPDWAGLAASAVVAPAEGDGASNFGANLLYFSGKLSFTAAYQKARKGVAIADTTAWQLGTAYDFGVAKLFMQYGHVKNTSARPGIDYKLADLSMAVPLGAGKVLVAYGLLAAQPDAKRHTLSLGYDHPLSRRTDVYATLMRDKASAMPQGRSVAVGIRHRF